MFFSKNLCSLLISAVTAVALQHHMSSFGWQEPDANLINASLAVPVLSPHDASLFTPVEDLSILSGETFTALGHPAFPKYSVRIKQSNWCDGSVRSAVGSP